MRIETARYSVTVAAAQQFSAGSERNRMSDQSNEQNEGGAKPEPGHFSARVPEKVARGVYSSGQVVIETPKEILMDFLMGITRPFSVVARVVVVPQTLVEFITALEQNLETYTKQYGEPKPPPTPPNE